MSKVKKLAKEQLSKLQGFVNALNQAQNELGSMEVRKHQLLHQIAGTRDDFSAFQKELEDEYGKVSINIEDGTLKEIENDTDESNSQD